MPSQLKKRVRERMAKTGESWSTAVRNIRAQEAGPVAAAPRAASAAVDEEAERRSVVAPAIPVPRVRVPRLIFATAAGLQSIDLRPRDVLGRGPRCSIQLLDRIVAGEHCTLEGRGGRHLLRDLGSLNGTYVNGERMQGERVLAHGDEIALGATRARYDDGRGPMTFGPPDVGPGVVAQPEPGGVWRPGGGNDGGGGAPPAIALPPWLRPN
jgi:hypothetical protein